MFYFLSFAFVLNAFRNKSLGGKGKHMGTLITYLQKKKENTKNLCIADTLEDLKLA